jgi:hypothetical protein
LNELFERCLCQTGLLEVGILVVRDLDFDGRFGVATLPNSEFVSALLSMRNVFVVAGEEVRLLAYDKRRAFPLTANAMDFSGGYCELSSLSDEDSQGRTVVQNSAEYNSDFMGQSDQGYMEIDRAYPTGHDTVDRRSNCENGNEEWYQSETWSASLKARIRCRESSHFWDDAKSQHRRWNPHVNSVKPSRKTSEEQFFEGNNPRVRVLKGASGAYHNAVRGQEAGTRIRRKCPDEGFRIISREGCSRTIQQLGSPEREGFVEMGRKRKPSDIVQGIPVYIDDANYRKMRHHPSHFP